MVNRRNHFTLSILYKVLTCLLSLFIILLSLISYTKAAPPLDHVSPTPAPDVTSTLINLSATKETIDSTTSDTITNMPTALPAVLAEATRVNSIVSHPLDLDITIMASDEANDAMTANQQDDEWRASAAAQGMISCVRGTLSDSDPNILGINETKFTNNHTDYSISYSLREIYEEPMGQPITEGQHAQGTVQDMSFMKETAPIPQELIDLGQAVAFEEQVGSAAAANGLLFTFNSSGVRAFGAWFGGLESRAPLEGSGMDGDPRGGKLAYMRLFDAEGRIIGSDRPIRPAQKEEDSLCLDANDQPIECGSTNTRWIGFIASQPISQMLLVIGDHDDSDSVPTCRVEADGGTEADFIAQCQAGDEHLSFVGPTICTERILESTAIGSSIGDNNNNNEVNPIHTSNNNNNHNETKNNNETNSPALLQFARERPMQSLAFAGIGISLLSILALWWRRRS